MRWRMTQLVNDLSARVAEHRGRMTGGKPGSSLSQETKKTFAGM